VYCRRWSRTFFAVNVQFSCCN